MKSRFFSARVFSLVFVLGYALAVFVNYPLFRYYPLAQQFSIRDLDTTTLGPSMYWYGYMASAAVLAVLVTAVVPRNLGNRIPAAMYWLVTILALAAALFREHQWFLPAS